MIVPNEPRILAVLVQELEVLPAGREVRVGDVGVAEDLEEALGGGVRRGGLLGLVPGEGQGLERGVAGDAVELGGDGGGEGWLGGGGAGFGRLRGGLLGAYESAGGGEGVGGRFWVDVCKDRVLEMKKSLIVFRCCAGVSV